MLNRIYTDLSFPLMRRWNEFLIGQYQMNRNIYCFDNNFVCVKMIQFQILDSRSYSTISIPANAIFLFAYCSMELWFKWRGYHCSWYIYFFKFVSLTLEIQQLIHSNCIYIQKSQKEKYYSFRVFQCVSNCH